MTAARWTTAATVLLCCSASAELAGQVTLGTGVRASTVGAANGERWRADQVVASALRFDRSWLAAGSDGALFRDQRGTWRAAGSLETALLVPPALGARLALVGSLGEPARDSALHSSRFVLGARVSRRVGPWGAWVAADVARSAGGDVTPASDFTSGGWRQLGSALLTLSLSSRAGASRGSYLRTRTIAGPDSLWDSAGVTVSRPRQITSQDTVTALTTRRWPEAEGRLLWSGGRWTLDVAVRGRLAAVGIPAAMWATADGTWLLTSRLALVGGVGTAPGGLTAGVPGHRHASLGLRLVRAAPLARSLPVELQPMAVGFDVQSLGGGVYRVAVRVPRARVVEVTGDFTAWKPVALHRANGDWWEATLPITPGTHQINLRVNGERWVAPPGTTVVDDDFAGVAGLIEARVLRKARLLRKAPALRKQMLVTSPGT